MSAAIGAACGDEAPADDVFVYRLSRRQTLAFCDELRDAASLNDPTVVCPSGEMRWSLPSNQACATAGTAACKVTAGELRRCLASASRDPCAFASRASDPDTYDECRNVDGCYPLLPTITPLEPAPCTPVELAVLQAFDGIYEVVPRAPISTCSGELPPVIDGSASHIVLLATERSGEPRLIVQSCSAVADCQALAREIEATGEPRQRAPRGAPNSILEACAEEQSAEALALGALSLQPATRDPLACPLTERWPVVELGPDLSSPSSLLVTVSALASTPDTPPGCSFIEYEARCDVLTTYTLSGVGPP